MPPDAPEYNTGCKRDTAFALRVQAGFCTVPPFFRSLFGSSLFSGPFRFCLFVVFVSFCFVLVSGFRFLSWPWLVLGVLPLCLCWCSGVVCCLFGSCFVLWAPLFWAGAWVVFVGFCFLCFSFLGCLVLVFLFCFWSLWTLCISFASYYIHI